MDTNLNPADYFTKKLEKNKCALFIDIISGSGSTLAGSPTEIPKELKKHMFMSYQYADHVPDRVHYNASQDQDQS